MNGGSWNVKTTGKIDGTDYRDDVGADTGGVLR
jgi:hypothetical protein